MNRLLADRVAEAVLYEGYILYPYRPSLKNRQRWTFGGLFPEAYCREQNHEVSSNQTSCLIVGTVETVFNARVRFLHLTSRLVGSVDPPINNWTEEGPEPPSFPIETLTINSSVFQPWQEAEAREVKIGETTISELLGGPRERSFTFSGGRRWESLQNSAGELVGILSREQQPVAGTIAVEAIEVESGLFRVDLRVACETTVNDLAGLSRDDALLRSLISTHAILELRRGSFVSLLDPPEVWRNAASETARRNIGMYPVLVGDEGETDLMLSSPIILYDYPQIAPESSGDFFDGTEIDELLTLRILTLTDEEKAQMASLDHRAGELLARTESIAREQLLGLHGTWRGLRPTGETFHG
jgi:hydrogenase maturation protease